MFKHLSKEIPEQANIWSKIWYREATEHTNTHSYMQHIFILHYLKKSKYTFNYSVIQFTSISIKCKEIIYIIVKLSALLSMLIRPKIHRIRPNAKMAKESFFHSFKKFYKLLEGGTRIYFPCILT